MFTRMLSPRRGRGLSLLAVAAVVLLTGTVAPATPAAAAGGFANAAYQRLWERADQPVAAHQATRSWLWGAAPQTTKQEPYAQGANGTRLVQYFDKARMEINNPSGDPTSPWYVTTGLLVVEMMTGQIQVGDSQFQQAYPATIPIAGDPNDLQQTAPTYAALNPFSGQHLGDNGRLPPGTPITWTLDKNGTFAQTGGRGDLAHIAVYSPDTQHNIADVFWQFMNQTGTIYANGQYQQGPLMNWIYVMGYPITDPFWTTIRVGGVDHQILVQAFQRRLLTYSPDNPAGWQVEMGNVGLAYYTWRYVQPTCSSVPVRGFGKVWGQHPELAERNRLRAAVAGRAVGADGGAAVPARHDAMGGASRHRRLSVGGPVHLRLLRRRHLPALRRHLRGWAGRRLHTNPTERPGDAHARLQQDLV